MLLRVDDANVTDHATQSPAFSCLLSPAYLLLFAPHASFVKSLSINDSMTTLAPIIAL